MPLLEALVFIARLFNASTLIAHSKQDVSIDCQIFGQTSLF
jgi:hypothetical protein